jgi:hypothetical protein
MAFKSAKSAGPVPNDPEALLRDLKGRKIAGLLAHQADMVRAYLAQALNESDVALQLPTGSGKTLIGLLIGEWRRRKFGERVLYLCPTIQLVHQVVEQARTKYGMDLTEFVGQKRGFASQDVTAYVQADTLAVATYSALFNSDPFFRDPQTIILDDAHAAESYISSNWSLKIERRDAAHAALYAAIGSELSSELTLPEQRRMAGGGEGWLERTWVEKIPTPTIAKHLPALHAIIDANVAGTKLRYPWSLLQDHLHACHWYVGNGEILVRPLVPPTNTHLPFANATQRIYMSATLGEGGDLERITGRRSIRRLPIPPGWDKQGIGRRFVVLPDLSLDEDESDTLTDSLISLVDRALYLVPDKDRADAIGAGLHARLGVRIFDGKELETSMSEFRTSASAVAVVANRYDGIDFPHDECRLEVIEGVPKSTHLQERFIVSRLGAIALLRDRIQTRLVQAIGRCTRDDTDYALVLVRGDEMHAYLLRKENRAFLHPELQAELAFGIEQSRDSSVDAFIDNAKLFFQQGKPWSEANATIIQYRSTFTQDVPPGTQQLREAVAHEIEYQGAMWHGNYPAALEACRKVLGIVLAPELRGYRALWYYLAGSAAWLASTEITPSLHGKASEYFADAMNAAPGVRWLASLAQWRPIDKNRTGSNSEGLVTLVERLELRLDSLGVAHDRDFANEEASILAGILGDESAAFERAHAALGNLLGFEAGRGDPSRGTPDAWWIVDEKCCIVFEDHSEAKASSTLDLKKARQVSSHPNWVLSELPVRSDGEVVPVLVTGVKKADRDALPHLKSVGLWRLDDFRAWGVRALQLVRKLRSTYPGEGNLEWRARAAEAYVAFGLEPARFVLTLRSGSAAELLG